MSDKPKETVIAEGTEFEGSVVSSCGITLHGRLSGELRAPSLRVNASGNVDGDVEVSELQSEGEVSGQIRAKNVQLSGKVSDRTVIQADTLEVKLSEQAHGVQVTFGNCELRVGKPKPATATAPGSSGSEQAKPKAAKNEQPQKVGL